jgi:hypothetical protein
VVAVFCLLTARSFRSAFLSLAALCSLLPLSSSAMDRMQRMFQQAAAGGRGAGPAVDQAVPDTSETVHISSLALLKMLKVCSRGILLQQESGASAVRSSETGL